MCSTKEVIMNVKIINAAFAGLIWCMSSFANAGLIIDGGSGSTGSSCLFSCVKYYQQAYDGDLFNDNQTITSISFFVGSGSDAWASNNSWQLSLSTVENAVNNLTTNYNDNIGTNSKIFDSRSFSGVAQAGEYITFTGNFIFDTTSGNDLLLSIKALGDLNDTNLINQSFSINDEFSAAYSAVRNINGSDESLFVKNKYGLLTDFNLIPVKPEAVPEPTTTAIFALALMGLASRSFKKS